VTVPWWWLYKVEYIYHSKIKLKKKKEKKKERKSFFHPSPPA
jgi:hypothetical protein